MARPAAGCAGRTGVRVPGRCCCCCCRVKGLGPTSPSNVTSGPDQPEGCNRLGLPGRDCYRWNNGFRSVQDIVVRTEIRQVVYKDCSTSAMVANIYWFVFIEHAVPLVQQVKRLEPPSYFRFHQHFPVTVHRGYCLRRSQRNSFLKCLEKNRRLST
jgi:hypothetical protein